MVLLGGGGVAPPARAGCETPTVLMKPTAGNAHPSEVGSPSVPLPHQSMPGSCPCSGPHCSRAPLAPATPPATTITFTQEWANTPTIPNHEELPNAAYRLEEGLYTPIFRTSPVYHPPR